MKKHALLIALSASMLTGLLNIVPVQESEAQTYRARRAYGPYYNPRRSVRHYGLRPPRDGAKERREKMERLEKSKTAAMENELWQRELRGLIPAGYGTVSLAHMSDETKELLKSKAEAQDRAVAEARTASQAAAQAAAQAEAARDPIEAEALGHLKAMSRFLARQEQFEIFADELREEPGPSGAPVRMQTRQHMAVARPDRMRMRAQGAGVDKEMWYDGEIFMLKNHVEGYDVEVPLAGTVSDLPDALYTRQRFVLPLADLLVTDLYEQASPYITRARYLGVSVVDGVRCHHVAVTSGGVDWEAWIQAQGDPMPKRVLIRYREEPGSPRYALRIHQIRKLKDINEDTFARPAAADL